MKSLSFLLFFFVATQTFAEGRAPNRQPASAPSRFTYDLSGAAGNYNGASYSELTLGLNWYLQDWLNWRNAIFTRQGSNIDSVQGLDTSARFMTKVTNDAETFGFDAFAGPGVRLATHDNTAVFAEAGLVFHVGGLRIGGGAKALEYVNNPTDTHGLNLPKNDTQFFLILGGGGVL